MPELTELDVREVCDSFAAEIEVVAGGPVEGIPEASKFDSPFSRNLILYGPPGTGKTYRTVDLALNILGVLDGREDRNSVTDSYRRAIDSGSIAFVTFHQSYSYEDFIEGIRPNLEASESEGLSYQIAPGVFKALCMRARMHPDDAFVLVIDEINRGNMSGIFGELITLIEDDKRLGRPECLTAILPYSRESFGVPDNVFIIGTMNTADRSLTGLDAALRRRFEFQEMLPQPELFVDAENSEPWVVEGVAISSILSSLNHRLLALRGPDYLVGHAFFMPLVNPERRTLENMSNIFRKKVLPLLREYFFDDAQSIMRALGQQDPSVSAWNYVIKTPAPLAGVEAVWQFNEPALDSVHFYEQVAASTPQAKSRFQIDGNDPL